MTSPGYFTVTFYDDFDEYSWTIPTNSNQHTLVPIIDRLLREHFAGKISYMTTSEGHSIGIYSILDRQRDDRYRVVVNNPDVIPYLKRCVAKLFCN